LYLTTMAHALFQHRWWLIPVGFIILWTLIVGVFGSYIDVPTVYIANGTDTPVGCMTSDMTEPKPITDSACQKALKGHYNTTWVAPDWRP